MDIGRGDAPPANGGEFLLQLLRKSPNFNSSSSSPANQGSQILSQLPIAAAEPPPHTVVQFNGQDFPFQPWSNNSSFPTFAPHNLFPQNPNANPNLNRTPPTENYGFFGGNYNPNAAHHPEQNLVFGSVNHDILQNCAGSVLRERLDQRGQNGNSHLENGLGLDRRLNGFRKNSIEINGNARQNGNDRGMAPPPGYSTEIKNVGNREVGFRRRDFDHTVNKGKGNWGDLDDNRTFDSSFSFPGSSLHTEVSLLERRAEERSSDIGQEKMPKDQVSNELDDLEERVASSLGIEDESDAKSDIKKHNRDKDYRSDKRGQWIMNQRMRNMKSHMPCRSNIIRLNAPFLAIFESLIPTNQEKVKQNQLMTVLEKLVKKEWSEARLYIYGSCGNSFGFSKSDIDICLATRDADIDKCDLLLKLADILESENFKNVQALTRARVPIVKLMDPDTSISCDICVNNLLAVVNTKLLRDYAQIDVRLRQLAFIVKHWAKSRGVNETYQGTLSSYAYVLMCINFLQQRRPAILPCLQGMEITYFANVDNVECAYFDQVEKLSNFGARNGESIGQLVWAFFHYWAYCHDYANDVISVRTGSTISKRGKDWTRRVGNDRHLICIEDPFEVSHDLGRVVDKYSIRVLREEFERAAHIMHNDPNPCAALFEPYVPN